MVFVHVLFQIYYCFLLLLRPPEAMVGYRNVMQEMEEQFAMVTIEDEEQGGILYVENEEVTSEIDLRWCLVGRFLTESPIDFKAMQHKMASLWRLGKGVYIKQLEVNRFIF